MTAAGITFYVPLRVRQYFMVGLTIDACRLSTTVPVTMKYTQLQVQFMNLCSTTTEQYVVCTRRTTNSHSVWLSPRYLQESLSLRLKFNLHVILYVFVLRLPVGVFKLKVLVEYRVCSLQFAVCRAGENQDSIEVGGQPFRVPKSLITRF